MLHHFDAAADGSVEMSLIEDSNSLTNEVKIHNTDDVCNSQDAKNIKEFRTDENTETVQSTRTKGSAALSGKNSEKVDLNRCVLSRDTSEDVGLNRYSSSRKNNENSDLKRYRYDTKESSKYGDKNKSDSREIDSRRLNQHVIYFDFGASSKCMFLEVNKKKPTPGRDEVIIEVEASTVSRTDCFIRGNQWQEVARLPNIPGCDCVGRVIRCGKYASRYGVKVGDRVATIDNFLGGNARFICVPAYQLISIPQELDAAEGACLLQTFVTAYQCLHRETRVKRGDKVLIVGANGAVGQACIQLACLAGAEVFSTSRKVHHGLVSSLGAFPLEREPHEWLPYVKGSMDIVIDCVCSDSYISSHSALDLLNPRSKLICVGMTAKRSNPSAFGALPTLLVSLVASVMPHTTCYDIFESIEDRPREYREDFNKLVNLVLTSKIKPRISKLVSLREVPKAHKKIEAGGLDGMIVCIPKLVKPEKNAEPSNNVYPTSPNNESAPRNSNDEAALPLNKINSKVEKQIDESSLSSESNNKENQTSLHSHVLEDVAANSSGDDVPPNMEHSSISSEDERTEDCDNNVINNTAPKSLGRWRSMKILKRGNDRLKVKGSF
eukprot:CAMPEP_0194296900 /NCGR_PEP_ID=MMETSP0169-20130528/57444_1 /TAXON_ID=218684 /ORGANISM="Corethron pennatum, Strain L29A3" /LENGTH=607 /DNA_ID=CAMNT_0039046539 /DNA_START=190 /DNA_END=2013 /DNA_ORIENTATION=-